MTAGIARHIYANFLVPKSTDGTRLIDVECEIINGTGQRKHSKSPVTTPLNERYCRDAGDLHFRLPF